MSYASEVLADSPYVYWKLDDTSGTTAADSSGNSRTGTYSGSPTLNQAAAFTGSSLSVLFDATNDYLLSDFTLNTSTVTLECWFDYDGTAAAAGKGLFVCGFSQGYDGTTFDKVIYIDENKKPGFQVYDGAVQLAVGASALSTAVHQLVGTFSSGTARIYVDGAQAGTVSASSTYSGFGGNNILVGGHTNTGSTPDFRVLAGRRDDVSVYTTDIGATRIGVHYTAGTASGATSTHNRSLLGVGI